MPRLRASQRSHPATVAAALLALTAATAQQPVLAGRVATPAGEPAAGAAVTLRWRIAPELPGLAGISLGDAGLAELVVQSDERGSFRIGLPHHGPFEIAAGLGDQRSAPQFPVMAGAFVELSLAEPVTVGGQVFDAAEQPVAGVDVRLVPEVTTWGRLAAYRVPEPRGGAVTDADGRFAIPFQDTYLRRRQVEPFVVFDFAVDGVACSTNDLLRPTALCRQLSLQLVPAERAHPRAPRAVSAKEPPAANWSTARLRARLIDGERPLPHATVLWSEIAGGSIAPPRESSTRTDADGVVELPNPELGAVVLGFVERDGLWLPFVRLRVPVAVGAIDLGDLAVAPRAVSGQVVDAHGAPVAGARVAVLPAAASDAELPYVTYTDHGGRYRFAALPSGPLRLWADCGTAGFASVDLDAAADVAVLQTPESGVISGVILSVDGQQFAGAWVMLVRSIGDTAMMPGVGRGTANLCVHADADGQVRVSGLPPGTWQVLGQGLRDGRLYGGGGTVATDGTFRLELRPVRG